MSMTNEDYDALGKFLAEVNELLHKWGHLRAVVAKIEAIQLPLGEESRIDRMLQLLDKFESQNYMLKDFFTIEEAARYLNLSKSTVYKMTSRGELGCYKPNSKTAFIARKDVNNWIQGNKQLSESELMQLAERYAQQLVKPNSYRSTPHFKKRK